LLLDAFDRILEGNRRLIIGITNGHEDIPGELARACEELANPPLLQVNVVREEVLALLARTAVSIYTLRPEANFRNADEHCRRTLRGLLGSSFPIDPRRSHTQARTRVPTEQLMTSRPTFTRCSPAVLRSRPNGNTTANTALGGSANP